jgi:hypothetical protein
VHCIHHTLSCFSLLSYLPFRNANLGPSLPIELSMTISEISRTYRVTLCNGVGCSIARYYTGWFDGRLKYVVDMVSYYPSYLWECQTDHVKQSALWYYGLTLSKPRSVIREHVSTDW